MVFYAHTHVRARALTKVLRPLLCRFARGLRHYILHPHPHGQTHIRLEYGISICRGDHEEVGERRDRGRAMQRDVEHARRCADPDRHVAVELHRQRHVALCVLSTELAKMARAYTVKSSVEDEDTFDDGAVLLQHGGVGDHADVEPTFEDFECLAARGGTAAALCNCGVCAKIAS